MSDATDPDEVITLSPETVDQALEHLETAMGAGERALGHDRVRPSTHKLAINTRSAYETLLSAHPDYELENPAEAGDD